MTKNYRYTLTFEDPEIQKRFEALALLLGKDYIYNGKPSPKRLVEAIALGKIPLKLEPMVRDTESWSSTRWQSLLVAVWLCMTTNQYAAACELVSLLSIRDEPDSIWREQIAYFLSSDWFSRYKLLCQLIESNQPFSIDYDNGSGTESHVIRHAFIECLPRLGLTRIRAFSTNRRSADSEPIESLAHNYTFCLNRILSVQPTKSESIEWLGSIESVKVTFELPSFLPLPYQPHPYDLAQEVLSDGRRRIERLVYDTSDLLTDLAQYLPNFEIVSPAPLRSYFSRIALRMHSYYH